MTEKTATPADIIAEADAVSKQAKLDMAAEDKVDATDLARQMSKDYKISLVDVKGTGKDGRVTVPDVDKFIKAKEKEAEEAKLAEEAKPDEDAKPDEEAEAGEEAKPDEDAKPVKESKAKEEKPKGIKKKVAASLLPNVIVGLTDIHHVVRSLSEMGLGWQNSKVSVEVADERLSEMLSDGWELVETQPLGYSPDGIDVLWVLGKFSEGKVERYPYREIHHITRRLGDLGGDGRGITGTQANSLISGYLQAGWDLALVKGLDKAIGGSVNMMWILVR